jgi:hypothetical protein
MEAAAIDEMTGSELLDHVGELAHVRMRCEAEILRAAVQHASLNAPEALDPGAAHHPGRERAVHVGGAATPEVTEFAAAELGARLGVSSWSARALMADGLDLVHRLLQLWRRVEAPAYLARLVARRTRELTSEQASYVDGRVAPYARLAQILADLGDAESRERRRVKALLILSRPDLAARLAADYQAWRDRPADPDLADAEPRTGDKPEIDWTTPLPKVVVFVHLHGGQSSEGVARVEGYGAVTETWVRDHLPREARFSIRPVFDVAGLAPVDSYEIPDRHRQAVRIMTPADSFPFSSLLGEGHQVDHTRAFRHGPTSIGAGQSRIGNYGPLSVLHHRIKTFGRWSVQATVPGPLHLARPSRCPLPRRPDRHPRPEPGRMAKRPALLQKDEGRGASQRSAGAGAGAGADLVAGVLEDVAEHAPEGEHDDDDQRGDAGDQQAVLHGRGAAVVHLGDPGVQDDAHVVEHW